MCNQCKQYELRPEFEMLFHNEYESQNFAEREWEVSSPSRNSPEFIKWVQAALNKVLGLKLTVDGKSGPATRSAIRSFQKQKGLADDGIVGAKTEEALKAAAGSGPATANGTAPSPAAPASGKRMVDPKKVSCATYDKSFPIFKALGTTDPVGALETICQRAVEMLNNTISELTKVKARVAAGEPPAWPLLNDLVAWALKTRMLMNVDDPAAWTGKGTRNAGLIIRWLTNIRDLIASRDLWYTCLDTTICGSTTWAWVYTNNAANKAAGRNFYRIHLCRTFWKPGGPDAATNLEWQAQTIIHETSHIYYNTEDSGMGPGAAECISQFIADANGSPIDPRFATRCGSAGPKLP